jgi:exosortase
MRNKAAVLLAVAAFLMLYRHVISDLMNGWLADSNYSHGFLVAPLAMFIVWQRRERLFAAPQQPSVWGLVLAALSLAALVVGVLGAEVFTTRLSMIGVVAGAVWFLYGRAHLRLVVFPLVLMLLTLPLPAIVFNQIALPLQSLAARAGETALAALQIPVLREGNIIILATGSLEVAEACSGIRSLMTLVALGVLYGYFTNGRPTALAVLSAAAVPIAVVANGVRVAGTGIAAAHYGAGVAEGFFHTFSGWLVFVIAFGLLVSVHRMLARVITWEVACQDA